MYEAGIAKQFRARHVMPGAEGPEGELHEHDYRMEVVVSRRVLDERGMVCDLDVLDAVLEQTVASVRGADLETIKPPEVDAVTVEVLARWGHERLAEKLRGTGVEVLTVRVWESPVAFGGYVAALADTAS